MRKAQRKQGKGPPFRNPTRPPEPQENKDSCDMKRLTPEEWDAQSIFLPGTFSWGTTVVEEGDARYECRHLKHVLPSGDIGTIQIEPVPIQIKERIKHGNPPKAHTWACDGNEEKPTLQPSVWLKGRWHGYFRAGRMESC